MTPIFIFESEEWRRDNASRNLFDVAFIDYWGRQAKWSLALVSSTYKAAIGFENLNPADRNRANQRIKFARAIIANWKKIQPEVQMDLLTGKIPPSALYRSLFEQGLGLGHSKS